MNRTTIIWSPITRRLKTTESQNVWDTTRSLSLYIQIWQHWFSNSTSNFTQQQIISKKSTWKSNGSKIGYRLQILGSSQAWMALRLENRPPTILNLVRISDWPFFFTVSVLLFLTLCYTYITKPFEDCNHASHSGRVAKNCHKQGLWKQLIHKFRSHFAQHT